MKWVFHYDLVVFIVCMHVCVGTGHRWYDVSHVVMDAYEHSGRVLGTPAVLSMVVMKAMNKMGIMYFSVGMGTGGDYQ